MTDTDLLKRLLAGEQKAFRELVATYQGAMRAVAYAIVGSRNADEVVQDAWLAVVRSLDGFQGRASAWRKPWPACPSSKAVCCTCVSAQVWNWRKSVTFCRFPPPMYGCCCTVPGSRCMPPLSTSRRPVNAELQGAGSPFQIGRAHV